MLSVKEVKEITSLQFELKACPKSFELPLGMIAPICSASI